MDIHAYLEDFAKKDCLKFVVAGSVDDGKSTLIGRLLFECKGIHADQLDSLEKASKKKGSDTLDFALLTDGLKSEREQGITIDVAYRYFSSPKRRFVIIDVPGHEQYTRNMATGASQADFGLLLIDAKLGLTEQTKRHSFILSLMGVSHVLIVINKMDLVDFKEERFEEIKKNYEEFSSRLNFQNTTFIPVSALHGDNVTEASKNIPWYNNGTVLSYLEKVTIQKVENLVDFRLPVQTTLIGGARRYAGTISSGIVRTGDKVEILPSGMKANVKDIIYMGEQVSEAFPPMAIQIGLDKELDVSRGDVVVHPNNHTHVGQEIEALVVWMDDDAPLKKGHSYIIKHTTLSCTGIVTDIDYGIDVNTLRQEDRDTLELNEIGRVRISLSQPLCFETYKTNRITGSFIVIDRFTHKTAALGTIINRRKHKEQPERNLKQFDGERISLEDRLNVLNSNPYTIWFTGLSGSGKSTLAYSLEKYLVNQGRNAFVLDGDTVRSKLNCDLGFSVVDREENIRRVAEIAKLFNDAGIICLCAFVSPYEQYRTMAKNIVGDKFFEVYVETPIEICRERREFLFSKAESGNILNFPGVNDRFDAPSHPALTLCGTDNKEDNLSKLLKLV